MKKSVKIVGGILVGGAVLGTGGLLLAPMIGGMVGSALFGWWGCAATSSGLAYLGGGALSVGGYGMAGGTAVVAGSSSVLGGILGGSVSSRFTKNS